MVNSSLASNVTVKEMKYRPKIGGGDFDTKTRKVEKFLDEGHKVKITIIDIVISISTSDQGTVHCLKLSPNWIRA